MKFSPPVHESAAARRIADLLILEHLALTVLRSHGHAVVDSELLFKGNRVMLETVRFDRIGSGRRAMVSGTSVDMQFCGVGSDWRRLAAALLRQGRIGHDDADTISIWQTFGLMIGNSDMHLGNLFFLTQDYQRFTLAPAYEMLPMQWAPTQGGELPVRELNVAAAMLPENSVNALRMAFQFWECAAALESLEGRFTAIANQALSALERINKQSCLLCGERFANHHASK